MTDVAGASFECRGRARVPELDGELADYVHRPTGARHLHLGLSVEDSAFLMAFLTPAPDSSGLPHVLEHLVMCGSERYPCRRAFFAMLGRTLSTTANALTTEDCTAYHFATRSLADYENLLSVYLDAAFFPRLDRLDFDQEGCRVELEAPSAGDWRPVRRGVVLNEMRGLVNDPEEQLRQALNRCLFPATPYGFNAGGDPWEMPALDHDALRAYHRSHYHPGNAVFLSAGRLPAAWLHTRLHELALARFSPQAPASVAGPGVDPRIDPGIDPKAGLWSFEAPPLPAPSRCVVRYPVLRAQGPDRGGGASWALAWRLGERADPMAVGRAQLLARCLLDQGDAPFRRALLESPGSPVTPLASNGVQATRRRLVFQCGVHGGGPDLAGDLESRVLAVLDRVACEGLARTEVESALAQMEREQRDRDDPRYPFPLKLLTRLLPAALYGGDPAAALDVSATFATLRAETGSRRCVAALVRACLRDNAERAAVTAIPDPDAGRRLEAEDRARLEAQYGPPHREARERVMERSRALRRRQKSRAGESSLPMLGLDAAGPPRASPELLKLPAGDPTAASGPTVHPIVRVSRGPTGGLVHANLAIDLPALDPDRLDDMGLLAEILPDSGHGGLGPAETRARIARVCDRLVAEPMILARAAPGSDAPGIRAPRAVLMLSARALAAHEEALLEVLVDAHLKVRIDRDARAQAARARARRTRVLARSGHLHAERIAAARLDPWAAVVERWQGPGALALLARAARDDGDGQDGDGGERLEERLRRASSALAEAPCELQMVRDRDPSADPGSTRVRPVRVPGMSGRRTTGPATRTRSSSARTVAHRVPVPGAWVMEGPVNYCARVYPAVTPDHPDAGPLAVFAACLGGDLLQRMVRERGGAYGAGARYCGRTCTVRVFSYRDPRVTETLHDFDRAIDILRRWPPAGPRLEEAILRAVREIDRPEAFVAAARERFVDELQGRDATSRQRLRASALDVGPGQLREVAERYLTRERGRTGVLAGAGREDELDRLDIPWRRL